MRMAIIADIHGNLDALDAALSDLRQQGAERLIVNGDVVNRGPDSVAVLERLLAEPGIGFTLGNHDDLLRLWHARSPALPAGWYADPFWGATDWSARQLAQAGLLGAAAAWPLTLEIDEPGLPPVLIAHGTAEHYREGLSERTPAARVAELGRREGGGSYGVLVGSHIHRPARAWIGDRLVLNTGAVGSPANGDPRAQYLLLQGGARGWQARFRAVPYDRSAVLRRFQTSGLLATGLSAEIFRQELLSSRSLYTGYWDWTQGAGLPRTAETWATFQSRLAPAG